VALEAGARIQKLRFDELADILRKLDRDAHFMAVDVFRAKDG
jgi:hypothetical protein